MPPTVVLIRHAQALHNIRDPGLSERGFAQCQQLRAVLQERLRGRLAPQLVLVSPMRRTLQTAAAALDWLPARVPRVAHAGWQETTDNPCDVGSPLAEVAAAFPQVDWGAVDAVFPDKTSAAARAYAYDRRALVARAQAVLAELHARPEAVVVVVSHSAFLSKAVSGCLFANADFRVFSFAEPQTGSETGAEDGADGLPPLVYRLVEWDETRQSHGGMGWSGDQHRVIGAELPERRETVG